MTIIAVADLLTAREQALRHRFIQRDFVGFRAALSGSETRRTFQDAWADIPLEDRQRLARADDWSDRLRTTWPAVWRAYLDDFTMPSVSLIFYGGDMAKIRALMAEFGMSFPDAPPPAFPDPRDFGITEDLYSSVDAAYRRTDESGLPELVAFGAALAEVASWHGIADAPGIPEHKLTVDPSMNDHCQGWSLRAVECAAALRIWRSLAERYGEAALMRRVGAEIEPELWSGWLVHLDGAARHDGLHAVGCLNAWSVLHRLRVLASRTLAD